MSISKRAALLVVCLFVFVAAGVTAQAPQAPASESVGQSSAVAPPPPASAPFDVEAATRAYLAKQSPDAKAKSDAYFEGGYWLQLWGFLYTLGVSWLLLGSGLSARMKGVG